MFLTKDELEYQNKELISKLEQMGIDKLCWVSSAIIKGIILNEQWKYSNFDFERFSHSWFGDFNKDMIISVYLPISKSVDFIVIEVESGYVFYNTNPRFNAEQKSILVNFHEVRYTKMGEFWLRDNNHSTGIREWDRLLRKYCQGFGQARFHKCTSKIQMPDSLSVIEITETHNSDQTLGLRYCRVDLLHKVIKLMKADGAWDRVIDLNDVKSYKLFGSEHPQINSSVNQGSATAAIIGGILLGGFGALLGSTLGTVSQTTTQLDTREVQILLKNGESIVVKGLDIYKLLIRILPDLEHGKKNVESKATNNDIIAKIKEIKQLLEAGVISEEEFAGIKKKIIEKM